MSQLKQKRAEMPLTALAVPIYLEHLLRTALQSADVFMLSQYDRYAVAAVGLVMTFAFFIMLIYTMVSSGTTVLISQYLGAGNEMKAGETAVASFSMGTLFAIAFSLFLSLGADSILSIYTLEDSVREYASQYLKIFGAGSVFVAFNIIQASILRAYGHAKDAMVANMVAAVLNVAGNALVLFGPQWVPVKGVQGVAVSTVSSQFIACVILAISISLRKDIHIPWNRIFKVPGKIIWKMLMIGIPTAGENISYSIMNIIINIPITQFGTAAMNTHTYMNTVLRFVFMPALSIGAAAQIKTGYRIGAKQFKIAKKQMWKYYGLGSSISIILVLVLFLLQKPVFGFFTDDVAVLSLIPILILISLARETGRTANIIVIPGLKGAGDVLFPVIVGMISMWGIAAGGGILLGKVLGLGLTGIWIGIAADELIRGLIMLGRWNSEKWVSKRMVDGEEELALDAV